MPGSGRVVKAIPQYAFGVPLVEAVDAVAFASAHQIDVVPRYLARVVTAADHEDRGPRRLFSTTAAWLTFRILSKVR